jgi:hypothetical protein
MRWEYTDLAPPMEQGAAAPSLWAILYRVTVHLMAVPFHHKHIRWFPPSPSEINSCCLTAGGLRPRLLCSCRYFYRTIRECQTERSNYDFHIFLSLLEASRTVTHLDIISSRSPPIVTTLMRVSKFLEILQK